MSQPALTVHNCVYVSPKSPRERLDGDTFRCQGEVKPIIPDADLWIPKVRLVRVNAPETGVDGAEAARSALITWLSAKPFGLVCYARDKYGRLLGDADRGDGLLSQYMLDHSLVVPMTTKQAFALLPEGTHADMARTIMYGK